MSDPNTLPQIKVQANHDPYSNFLFKHDKQKISANIYEKVFFTPQKNNSDTCYLISSDKYSNSQSMTPFYVYNKKNLNYIRQKNIYDTLKRNLKYGKANYVYANLSSQSKEN